MSIAPRFAHHCEARLAEMLDAYGVAWEYEPTTFVLERDPDGAPTSAFRPDFYLPASDSYLELTVLRQCLTRHKRRKARLAAELYGVAITVLYRRDLEAIGVWGREAA